MEGRTIELRGHGGDTLAARFFEPTPRHGERAPGIVLVREVLASHGGEVGVDDSPEGGACVWFSLPGAPTSA